MDDDAHLTKTQARAGSASHVTRYVLAISLVGIVIIFAALLLIWR